MLGALNRTCAGFAWRESGEGGVPVLFLHGLGGSSWSWRNQLGRWPSERLLLAWDLPGYGDSAPLPLTPTFAQWAESVFRWADAADVDRFHLVGISMGGMIAQYAAANDTGRIASLSLMATSPRFGLDGTQPNEWLQRRLAPLEAGQEPKDFAETVLRSLVGPGCSERAFADQVAAMRRISSEAMRASLRCLVTHDSGPVLHSIGAPTLILVGSEDRETPPSYAQALAEGIEGAHLEIIPNAGHLLNAEAPRQVNQLIDEHIRAHE